jgi:hypothetical protein
MIAEFKLIPGLNNLFDKLIWRKHSASALVLHGHNQNCDCSPVSGEPGSVQGLNCKELGVLRTTAHPEGLILIEESREKGFRPTVSQSILTGY